MIHEVEKFNPYHDRLGRFTSAGAAASFTIRTKDPKKQHMADMAIAREKEKNKGTNNAVAVAGVQQGKPMTHEEADEMKANPNYDVPEEVRKAFSDAINAYTKAKLSNAPESELTRLNQECEKAQANLNKAEAESMLYKSNCQSCVMAYEARRRGYDVVAKPREKSNAHQSELAKHQEYGYKDRTTGKIVERITNDPKIRTSKQAEKWLNENVEEGGRYAFSHGWKGTNGYVGHVIVAEKINGKIRLCDPQSGKTYSGADVTKYMSRIKSTYSIKDYYGTETKGRLGLVRMDNADLNMNFANAVLEGAKK